MFLLSLQDTHAYFRHSYFLNRDYTSQQQASDFDIFDSVPELSFVFEEIHLEHVTFVIGSVATDRVLQPDQASD